MDFYANKDQNIFFSCFNPFCCEKYSSWYRCECL